MSDKNAEHVANDRARSRKVSRRETGGGSYLFAVGRGDGAVAVLGEAHLEGDVEGHGALFLGEILDDGDCFMDGLVRADKKQQEEEVRVVDDGRAMRGAVIKMKRACIFVWKPVTLSSTYFPKKSFPNITYGTRLTINIFSEDLP